MVVKMHKLPYLALWAIAVDAVDYSVSQSGVQGATSTVGEQPVTTSMDVSVEDLWNLYVGPVSVAAINTTVSPTPVPSTSLIPPPPLYYSPFPTGQQVPDASKNSSWSFPADFWWGVAGAAYQIEGAVQAEGRAPSIWDVLTHRVGSYITGNTTGDVSDNNYYMYKEDIARIAAMGTKVYSFSVSWSRIFPFGRGQINQAGLAHYDDVIATCLEYGVQPAVTIYHWDLPLWLQNLYGGWLSSEIVDDFNTYAELLFQRWGDKVAHWFTVNEPIVFCGDYPLPAGYFRPSSIPLDQQQYFCGHNVILAHSKAYRTAKSIGVKGTVTFKNNGGFKIPLTSSSADAEAVQRAWDFNEGWFADPIFLTGDYPASLKQYVGAFLPNFTADEMAMIKGSADLFAHDAYTSQFFYAPDGGIEACMANSSNSLYPGCFNSSYTYSDVDGGWLIGPAADPGSPWLHKATDWIPAFTHYIQDTWKPAGGIALSEFGFSVPFEDMQTLRPNILTDLDRSVYYVDYLHGILIALSEGVNIVGCLAWSIYDNLEWQTGYSVKFGMQYVNFSSPGLERYYKASYFHFVDVFNEYQLPSNGTSGPGNGTVGGGNGTYSYPYRRQLF